MQAVVPSADHADADDLVPREMVVLLRRLARGATVADAATACGISTATARRRLGQLRSSWGCANTVALVVVAVRRGLI